MRSLHALLLSLTFASGCFMGYESMQQPVQVTPTNSLFYKLKRYTNISQAELESRLVKLAQTAAFEEAWAYNITKGELTEAGTNETATTTVSFLPSDYMEENGHLILYHIHPLLSSLDACAQTLNVVSPLSAESLEQRLKSKIFVPSPLDIQAAIGFHQIVSGKNIKLESKIADRQGILTYSLSPSLTDLSESKVSIVSKIAGSLALMYYLDWIDFDIYCKRMHEQTGIDVSYRFIEACQFRLLPSSDEERQKGILYRVELESK